MLIALALWVSGQEATPSPFDWLVGRWCTEPKGETQSCESWTPMDAGVMRGEGKTRTARATRREAMRITVEQSGAFFHAEPDGQAPTDFRAVTVDLAARAATFENRAHDYPQRVRYWRAGELLIAEISMADGTRTQRWAYVRVDQETRSP